MNGINVDRGEDVEVDGLTLVTSDPYVYHTYSDDSRLPSETIIEAVAAIRDVNPTETRIPLVDVVDPDAFDALFSDTYGGMRRTGGHITFTIEGLTVCSYSNGHVLISEQTDEDMVVGR